MLSSAMAGGQRRRNRYNVFLSFRGRDVRRGFVDHLYHSLTSAGFSVFLDTQKINKGDDISSALHHAIEVSHILIPIFSHNYAQSIWCLKEVSLIAHQVLHKNGKDSDSAIAVPLFYDVTPSHVRHPHQSHGNPFAEAFQEHESSGRYSPQEIDEWKTALSTISRFSGWSLQQDTNGYEAALVKRVVEDVGKLSKRRRARL